MNKVFSLVFVTMVLLGGVAVAENMIDIEQTGQFNELSVIQQGKDNILVGADAIDGSIDQSLQAVQSNSMGGNSLDVIQQGTGNRIGLTQEGHSLTSTTATIRQFGNNNDLGVNLVVNGGGSNHLTVTQNGSQSLKIKKIINVGNYDVTITQP